MLMQPLFDRLDKVLVPGYSTEEKIGIFKFMWKNQTKSWGVCEFPDDLVLLVVRLKGRAPGVRELERTVSMLKTIMVERAERQSISFGSEGVTKEILDEA